MLALRGAQTPGELRTRTERYVTFDDLDDVQVVLESMAQGPEPLVVDLGRGPGQSQNRWTHLLSGEPVVNTPSPVVREGGSPARSGSSTAELVARIDRLEQRLVALEAELGLEVTQSAPGD